LAVALAFSCCAFAQQATIVRTMTTDPSGASLPNVNITITNTESGAVRNLQTNTAGQYVVPDLNIGHYGIRAEATGFKAAEKKNVVLQIGDRVRLDFEMQVGGIQEVGTVEANPVRVQTA
jgi:hypothetical protein